MSFDFLLSKQDNIPQWILQAVQEGDAQPFWAFLAGYADAEGCFDILKSGSARFRLSSYDVGTLRQAREVLNTHLDILCPQVHFERAKGTPFVSPNGKQYFLNRDYWCLGVYRKASLNRVCELLEPYLKHAEKRQAMYAVWANVIARGVD